MTLNNVSSYHPQYWSLGIKKKCYNVQRALNSGQFQNETENTKTL